MTDSEYINQLKDQIWSFAEAMAEAIDARTPYNATHIRKVTEYAEMVALYINKLHGEGLSREFFDANRLEQLKMSALLHDVGKIVTPTKVMNKSSRLEGRLKGIREHFLLIKAYLKIDCLNGIITSEEYTEKTLELDELERMLTEFDAQDIPDETLRHRILEYRDSSYVGGCGNLGYLSSDDIECVEIERGTLTDHERRVMESHVNMTKHILSRVKFYEEFKNVPLYAGMHHEMLDGSGYPSHLSQDEIPLEARILAVCDICDALLAADRPYKSPMKKPAAFEILRNMADEGRLDKTIVEYLITAMGD